MKKRERTYLLEKRVKVCIDINFGAPRAARRSTDKQPLRRRTWPEGLGLSPLAEKKTAPASPELGEPSDTHLDFIAFCPYTFTESVVFQSARAGILHEIILAVRF